jgi:hypothetical protein
VIDAINSLLSDKVKGYSITVMITLIVTVLGYNFYNNRIITNSDQSLFAGRDFQQIPFDEYDATRICNLEAEARFGKALLHTHINDHSSRYQPDMEQYIIVLQGYIAMGEGHEETDIYCHVDPQKHIITHYKSIYPNRPNLISKALRFFS